MTSWPRRIAHGLIRVYQLTLSSILGRHCRYLPTCSDYTDEAITLHGVWAGGWIGLATSQRFSLCSRAYDSPAAK